MAKIFVLDLSECIRIRTGERGFKGHRVKFIFIIKLNVMTYLIKIIKETGVEFIDLKFTDLTGLLQHFTISVTTFLTPSSPSITRIIKNDLNVVNERCPAKDFFH